jgi:hypothetical protein
MVREDNRMTFRKTVCSSRQLCCTAGLGAFVTDLIAAQTSDRGKHHAPACVAALNNLRTAVVSPFETTA